jgi:hypothetical protein
MSETTQPVLWRRIFRIPHPRSAVDGTVQTVKRPGHNAARRAKKRDKDRWVAWGLELLAIGFPAFVLIVVKYIKTDQLEWAPVASASGQGIFLYPLLVVCVDVARRWFWEVIHKGGRIYTAFRCFAIFTSIVFALLCLVPAALADGIQISSVNVKAIDNITLWCVITVVPLGTLGVFLASRGDHR